MARAGRDALADRPAVAPALDVILPTEAAAVVAYALAHPKDGYRRLAWRMVDADVAYLSPSSVYQFSMTRTNGTEDNVVLWTFNEGKRSFVKRASENFPLELGTWHELKVAIHETQLQGFLDGKAVLDFTLKEPVSGKVGVWSKTDSMTEFSNFTVTPATK